MSGREETAPVAGAATGGAIARDEATANVAAPVAGFGKATAASASTSASLGQATATAHANIALIKYWGKANDELIIPRTSSLSLTLDELYTTTTVQFLRGDDTGPDTSIGGKVAVVSMAHSDRATLDGKPVTGRPMERISALLDIVRERAGISAPAEVTSHNTVPTAAGLASSASGFAALAGAAAAAAGLDLSERELSRLARRGSGSASRSIFGGLAIWNAGHDDESSYAEQLEPGTSNGTSDSAEKHHAANIDTTDSNASTGTAFADELALIVLVLNAGPKAISSREAMRLTIETSPEYESWICQHAGHLAEAQAAVAERDLVRLGEAAEANALGMHAAMRASTPSVNYLSEASHAALRAVRDARASGFPAWATMDAGPNVKVLTSTEYAEALNVWLRERLDGSVPGFRTIVTHAGPGLKVTR